MSDEDLNTTSEQPTTPDIDPIVKFLASVQIGDQILQELDSCGQSVEKYKKYYQATDLFILKEILGNVRCYESEPDNPNFQAFNNLIKWMMYLIATNPWWHRKLCYFNRMMGVNTNNTSYWHLQYHPNYIPGPHWNDNLEQPPEEFNNSQMDQAGIYKWIDEELDNHQ